MSYFVFSRKYRPQKFGEVVAQKHISETLCKAIEHERVSQAYLFCGLRGTGKTSVARILAKRLNCLEPVGPEPCDQCDSCVGIIKGRSLDVLEIDAASNTSVDDVRELRESIKYTPIGGKHKVYIIDEVHRLSSAAFDALLKTLEEPPAHAVFIFATTDVHKVPQTILSRCQRYDFRRIPDSELRESLKQIAQKENLKITDEALAELARRGDGSLRDSLTILDQVASWQRETIDVNLLAEALGILPRGEYREIVRQIRDKNAGAIIAKISEILASGVDASEFARGFQEELRLMIVYKAAPEIAADYGITTDDAAQYDELTTNYAVNDLLRIQNLLVNFEQKIRDGFEPVINLELTLLKLINMETTVSLEATLKQLLGNQGKAPTIATANPNPFPATGDSKKKLELISPAPQPVQSIRPAAATSALSDDLQSLWQKFLQALKSSHRNLQIKLSLAQPRSIEEGKISVAFDRMSEFHVRQLQDREITQTLEQVLRTVSGRNLRFHFFVDKNLAHQKENGKEIRLFTDSDKQEHTLVAQAMEIFDADVVGREDLKEK